MEVRRLTEADVRDIASWRYPGRYSTYDVGEVGEWWAVGHDGELVGYCCFGADARVPGVEAEEGTLDVGYGMRPDLMGRGSGRSFVSAILRFAASEFGPARMRLVILDWNARSRSVALQLGFEEVGSVVSGSDRYVLLELRDFGPSALLPT